MPALSAYEATTQSLIQSPQSPVPLITPALLTSYVNIARQQVAIDGECVRTVATGTVAGGLVEQPLSGLTIFQQGTVYEQAIVVRNAALDGARVDIRPWDWFVAYNMPPPGLPTPTMAQLGRGSLATLYISSPNGGALWTDVVALPVPLVDDTTFDAIPYPWSDAVPFYAAWYCYMAFQRQADADMFMGRYRELMHRAGSTITSTNLPENDPGGIAAQIAAGKIVLGTPPAPPPQSGGGGR